MSAQAYTAFRNVREDGITRRSQVRSNYMFNMAESEKKMSK